MSRKVKALEIKNLEKKIVFVVLAGLLLYIAMGVFADAGELVRLSREFNWFLVIPILGLAFLNYIIRFVRWQYYLKLLEISLDFKDSAAIFFSGLVMSISPGKFGELVKSYFLKKINNTPVSVSAPIVLAERLTDLIAVLLLASLGIFSFNYGEKIFWVILGVVMFLIFLIGYKPFALFVLNHLGRSRRFDKLTDKLKRAYLSAFKLCVLPKLIVGTILGIFAWFSECLAFYLLFSGLGVEVSLWNATFIYAFATLAGAVSFLPGGLGVTEASMVSLLILFLNLQKAAASFATILIRFATLWFAVLIGFLAFFFNRKRLKA